MFLMEERMCVYVWEWWREREREQSRDEGEAERLYFWQQQKLYWLKYFFNNNSFKNFLVDVDNI